MRRILFLAGALLLLASPSWALRKNVGSQIITGLLISKTDGSAVTSGTTTVYLDCDAVAQANAGTATHAGNGVWVFTPDQAETNCDHATYTFTNATAISDSVQFYPGEIPGLLSEEHGSGPWVK